MHCTQTFEEQTGVLPEQSPLKLQPPLGMHVPFVEHAPLRHTVLALPLVHVPPPVAYPHLLSVSQTPLVHWFAAEHVVPLAYFEAQVPLLHQFPEPHWLSALQLALQEPSPKQYCDPLGHAYVAPELEFPVHPVHVLLPALQNGVVPVQ